MGVNQLTPLTLSKWLLERGFEKPSKIGWYVRKGHPKKPTRLIEHDHYEFNGDAPEYLEAQAYDLLWDLCIKYGEEIFGEMPHRTGEPGVSHMQRVIDLLVMSDDTEMAENYIKLNSILK